MHYHIDMRTHGTAVGEPVVATGGDKLIACWYHSTFLSETNGSCRAQTWTDRFTDKDANHYAIPPPPFHMW